VGEASVGGGPKESVNQTVESESVETVGGASSRDPLMTMLLRLQEAASYSSTQSNESDSASLDSHGGSSERIASLKTV